MGLAGAGIGLAAGVSLLQARQRVGASKIAAGEAETAARFEELGSAQREVDRKSRLADALASQNAMAGVKGIAAFEGSPLSILESDIKAEQEATGRDIFQTKLRSEALRSGAKIQRRQAKVSAGLGLLSNLGQMATAGGGLRG